MKKEPEKQPFERHTELSEAIAQAACTWQVDMTTWNKLLSEVNKVCRYTQQLQEENDRLKGEVEELEEKVLLLSQQLYDNPPKLF